MTKTWYNVSTGNAAVFDDSEDISNWPDFRETQEGTFLEDSVRHQRAILLSETDIWALTDRPALTAEQTAYRQALRDITDQAGFPADITWPTKPE